MGGGARSAVVATLTIRPAELADLPAIVAIEQAVFPDPWSEAAFRTELRREGGLVLVACQRREVVGYAVAWTLAADEAELGNIAVAETARRTGVGKALLDALLETLARRQVGIVFLEVRAGNVAAQALYRAHGFEAVGRRPGYYAHPTEDAVLMRRAMR